LTVYQNYTLINIIFKHYLSVIIYYIAKLDNNMISQINKLNRMNIKTIMAFRIDSVIPFY